MDEQKASLRGLQNLERQIQADWDANGEMVASRRAALQKAIRPNLRQALRAIGQSREVLLTGNMELHELYRDRARMFWLMTLLQLRNPHSDSAVLQTKARPVLCADALRRVGIAAMRPGSL